LKEVIEKYIQEKSIDFINTADIAIDANELKFKGKKLKSLSDKQR